MRGHSSHRVMPHAIQDINKEHVSVIVLHHNTEEKLAMETLLTSYHARWEDEVVL